MSSQPESTETMSPPTTTLSSPRPGYRPASGASPPKPTADSVPPLGGAQLFPVPQLATKNLVLRGHDAADIPAIMEYAADPEAIRWTSLPVPYALRDAEEFIALANDDWAADRNWLWAILAPGGAGQPRNAGNIVLRRMGRGQVDMGFLLAPWARGRGLMTAAVRLVADWAFAERAVEQIQWRAAIGNWASRSVATRCGFRILPGPTGRMLQRGQTRPAWSGVLHRPGTGP
ncbi:MAG: GNAT family N-acetyltransferase [Angustibacter sp.]